jgi:hypothetical protein
MSTCVKQSDFARLSLATNGRSPRTHPTARRTVQCSSILTRTLECGRSAGYNSALLEVGRGVCVSSTPIYIKHEESHPKGQRA